MEKLLWVIPCPECGYKYRLFDAQLLGQLRECPSCGRLMTLEPPREKQPHKKHRLDALALAESARLKDLIGPETDDRAPLEVDDAYRTDSGTPPPLPVVPPTLEISDPAESPSRDPFRTDDPGADSNPADPVDKDSGERPSDLPTPPSISMSVPPLAGGDREIAEWRPPAPATPLSSPRLPTPLDLPDFAPAAAMVDTGGAVIDEETVELPPLAPSPRLRTEPALPQHAHADTFEFWRPYVPVVTGFTCGLALAILIFGAGPAWTWILFSLLGAAAAAGFQWLRTVR